MRINKYNKDGYTVFKHEYVNLTDFLDALLSNRINYDVFGDQLGSESSDYSFSQTRNFNEAWNMCRFGWNKGFEEFRDEIRRIEFEYAYKFRKVNAYKPIGGSPSVPRYLLGLPNNMHYKEKVRDKKIIDVYFNIACDWRITHEQIINRGVLTLALISHLERTNFFGINLHFVELVMCDDEILYLDIPLKNDKERLNIKKCYFPIVHPSFLRRLCFRACEITPVRNAWNYGYGSVMNFSNAKFLLDDNLDNSIYISSPREMGIMGDDLLKDLDVFINVINSKYGDILDENDNYTKKRSRY